MFPGRDPNIGEEFEIESARYHKTIIMTDADVDGAHIRCLILTFFYRYMKEMIEAGYVYIAQPPLYKVTAGKKQEYAYSDRQLQQALSRLPEGSKYSIQRFKGLGEMNAEQLWDTTLNPDTRRQLPVHLGATDFGATEMLIGKLMGKGEEAARRELMELHGDSVEVDV